MNTQTRIKLKGLKIYTGMSQETVCFNATILFDGLSIGTAENDGHGGETCANFESGKKDLFTQAESYAKGLLPICLGEHNGKPYFTDANLIEVIDHLVGLEERNRKTKSSFKRVYRKKICVLRDSRLWVVGYKTQTQYASYIAQIKKEHGPDIVILDDLEHDEAFELYSKHLYA
ncbi:hypothetical protein F384_26110 (plasmid) [Citrobacter amalonaticus Y19]|uniref:Uncharacterized protein n=1 Tax=Citrobacter amalonaticus Y19 TaxID=1261127 RepID=A0A0F6U087_CITAM|nr:hypothetical protein [Citrobacter amalonaticus]AKE62054.1 hypothetical protein F384_26110 [Citrobacter amalonaticus Y19]